jgi:isoleucyl-tRNA synthetase
VKGDGSVLIMDETLAPEEVQIVYRGTEGADMAAEGGVVVSLETVLTDELILEGDMRDLVRHIQRLRKEKGYTVSDKVTLGIEKADAILTIFKAMIEQETNVTIGKADGELHEVDIGENGKAVIFIHPK